VVSHHLDRLTLDPGTMDVDVWVPDAGHGPGLVLLQEIFGVGPYVRGVAERLAAAGYVVGAPDLFWRFHPRWIAEHDAEGLAASMAKAGQLDVHAATSDSAAVLEHLASSEVVDGTPGVLGFCLGGTLAFRVAVRSSPSVAVCYYGSGIPTMIDDLARITCPMLLHFGSTDPYIPGESLEPLVEALARHPAIELNVELAGHAFDNDKAPMFYDEAAARAAWAKTMAFLGQHLPAA
jgi:carboxymethylenebutenolidase